MDLLKILLSLMVVGIHTRPLVEMNSLASEFLVNGIFRVAVPIFFVINGYFIPEKKHFFSWAKKVGSMYLVWMLVYFPWYFPVGSGWYGILKVGKIFVFGYYHLWYLASYLLSASLLIFFPGVRRLINFKVVVLFYCAGVSVQYFSFYGVGGLDLGPNFYRNSVFFALPMICVGFLIKNNAIRFEKSVVFLIGCFILFAEILAAHAFGLGTDFDMPFSMLIIAPCVFCYVNSRSIALGEWSKRLSSMSVYVYLVHPVFIWCLTKFFLVEYGSLLFVLTATFSILFSLFLSIFARDYLTIFGWRRGSDEQTRGR